MNCLFLLLALLGSDILDRSVDLGEERVVGRDSTPMPSREDMLIVIGELLATYGTDDVTRTGFRFLYIFWSLFSQSQFLGLLGQVLQIFLIQEALVLFGKFALFLQLEDARSKRRTNIEVRDVVFSNIDTRTKVHLERLLLWHSVHRKEVALVSVLVLILLSTN